MCENDCFILFSVITSYYYYYYCRFMLARWCASYFPRSNCFNDKFSCRTKRNLFIKTYEQVHYTFLIFTREISPRVFGFYDRSFVRFKSITNGLALRSASTSFKKYLKLQLTILQKSSEIFNSQGKKFWKINKKYNGFDGSFVSILYRDNGPNAERECIIVVGTILTRVFRAFYYCFPEKH